ESYINRIVPEASDEESRLALQKALDQMASMGLTSVHDAGIGAETWELYKNFADAGKMTTRIYAMIGGSGKAFDKLSENGPVESYANDRLALRSVKMYSD